jgi:signal transduction histidine kinase
MSFLNSFYIKVSSLFLVLLLAMGAAQVLITMGITEQRQIEIDQLVNRDLARDMASEIEPVLAEDGDIDRVGAVIHYMMVLNPSIEIYLLDDGGRILGFFAEPGKEVQAAAVSLEPILEFLDHGSAAPIYGDDPRQPGTRKIFSAAPITLPGGEPGYLYIVLRSTLYDAAADRLRHRYLTSALVQALILSIACVGIAGLALFALLTRRLQAVARSVREFEQGSYDKRVKVSSRDEIGKLGRAFNRMADTIAANMEKLKQTDSLRRELIANVSHDLRSPLTSIQGYVETLLMKHRGLDRAQIDEYLQIILSDAVRLNELVHQLFELSKYEARQMEPKLERFSLTELMQDVSVKYRPQAEKQRIALEARLPEKLLPVRADIHMIERVLSNLIENALDHTPERGRVTLELEERDRRVQARVIDSGKGIAKEDIPLIFERFYSDRKVRSRSERGRGLGLAIAQKILELHSSRIRVDSQPGRGSVFYFELPREGKQLSTV